MPTAVPSEKPTAAIKMKQTGLGDFWRTVRGGRVEKRRKAPVKKALKKSLDASHLRKQQHGTAQAKVGSILPGDEDETTRASRDRPDAFHDGPPTMPSSLSHSGFFSRGDKMAFTSLAKRPISKESGKKIPASKAGPILVNDGQGFVGQAAHRALVTILTLQQDSSALFGGPNKMVPKTNEAAESYRLHAESYPLITSSTVVKTKDGVPLLYFLKDGMLAGLTEEEKQRLPAQSLSAIRALIDVYPPPPPEKKDSRVTEEQRVVQLAKKQAYGRYYLSYWKNQGRSYSDNHISLAAQPKAALAMRKLKEYLDATRWEHVQIAKWISALDPKMYRELHNRYQSFGPEQMKHLYQGPEACHCGLALLVNVAVDPHKDQNDADDSWTSTNVSADFEGGFASFQELGISIAQKPGDLVLCHAAVLTHMVGEITKGERFCHVRFTKKDVLRPPTSKEILCPYPGCYKRCTSKNALRNHLRGPTEVKRRENRTSNYHYLDAPETREFVKQGMQAWENAAKLRLESHTGDGMDEDSLMVVGDAFDEEGVEDDDEDEEHVEQGAEHEQ